MTFTQNQNEKINVSELGRCILVSEKIDPLLSWLRKAI